MANHSGKPQLTLLQGGNQPSMKKGNWFQTLTFLLAVAAFLKAFNLL